MISPIEGVEGSVPVTVKMPKKGQKDVADVTLASRVGLDRDFELLVALRDVSTPSMMCEFHPEKDSHAVLLSFLPNVEPTTGGVNTEIVLVVDRSGSMGGEPIKQARVTLDAILDALPAGVFFNICGFGSQFQMLFKQAVAKSPATLQKARAHVSKIEADLGGTALLEPLEAIYSTAPRGRCARQIMVLTDGSIYNTTPVINLVRKHSGTTRVFTFGLGHGASRELVSGMARAGGGAAEFILEEKDLAAQVLRQFRRAMQPAITALKLDWQGADVRVFPFHLRPIFHGDAYQILAFIKAKQPRFTCRLSGSRADGRRVTYPLPVDLGRARQGTVVHTLVAREAIRDLEDGASYLHLAGSGGGASSGDGGLQAKVKAEILSLGLAYSLASTHTSFLAVEERAGTGAAGAASAAQAKSATVPQYQPAGRHPPRRSGAAPKVGGANQRRWRRQAATRGAHTAGRAGAGKRGPCKGGSEGSSEGGSASGEQREKRRRKGSLAPASPFRVQPHATASAGPGAHGSGAAATPFGFAARPSTSVLRPYGADAGKDSVWSPVLTHGFAGPRGSRHLCWLTSSVALAMSVGPWRGAMLRRPTASRRCTRSPWSESPLLQSLAELTRRWVDMQGAQEAQAMRSKRRVVHKALDELALVFGRHHGMQSGQDQDVARAMVVLTSALQSAAPGNQVQRFVLTRAEGRGNLALCFDWALVSKQAELLVIINPGCGILPNMASFEARGFHLHAFLSMESLQSSSRQVMEHCVCLAHAESPNGGGGEWWVYDDNLNEQGFQGGRIGGSLATAHVEHYQERVPAFVLSRSNSRRLQHTQRR